MAATIRELKAIPQEKFLEVLKKEGVPYTIQSGFIRVEGPAGRRMYVANTKQVRRVDISGFSLQHGGVTPLKGELGRVKQQLDFKHTEDVVLKNFADGLKYMMSLPPSETARKLPERKAPGEMPRPSAPDVFRAAAAKPIPTLGGNGHKKENGGGKGRKRGGSARAHVPPRPSA